MEVGCSMSLKQVYSGTCFSNRKFMEKLEKILKVSRSQKAIYREQILEFHTKYGTQATKDAFGIGKTTIYRWRKVYLKSRRDATVLIPKSTRPHNTRKMKTDPAIVEFIRSLRIDHRKIGKEKIKPLLDEYCNQHNIVTVSEPTIGRIIKRNNLFFQKRGRIYHDPTLKHTHSQISYKSKAKGSPHVSSAGYLEIDTITRWFQSRKIYIINCIDVYTRFSFSQAYASLSSRSSLDFLSKLQVIYPFYHTIQTDNGLEFHGLFEDYLNKHSVKHIFTYPRCPKINGYVERANRSLSEEFLEDNLVNIHNIDLFNQALHNYTFWYNNKRVHKGLKNITPMNFISNLNLQSHIY